MDINRAMNLKEGEVVVGSISLRPLSVVSVRLGYDGRSFDKVALVTLANGFGARLELSNRDLELRKHA